MVLLLRQDDIPLHPKPSLAADTFYQLLNIKDMRNIYRLTAGTLCAAAMTAGLNSCQPQNCITCEEEGQPAVLTLSLESDISRSTSSQTQEQDNTINTLDVFIFRDGDPDAADYQRLDTYKRFEGDALADLSLSTTTGTKHICVIANSNISTYAGITTLTAFRSLAASLADETLADFTMYGEATQTLGVTSSVSILLTRLISRIAVTSIRTSFTGSPYQGMSLTDCRLFLTNVHASKLIYNNGNPDTPVILNEGALSGEDVNSTAEAGLLMDNIAEAITDQAYTTAHYLYCYSNETDVIDSSTKLVLQADLDGVTYYYPIPVNQTGYGYLEENGHFGIRRNTAYSFGITVTRPGSLDPETPVVPGTLEITLEKADWNIIPNFDKVF